MSQCGARAKFTIPQMIISFFLFFLLTSGSAHADAPSAGPLEDFHQSLHSTYRRDIQCDDLGSDSAFCNIRTELRYHNYLSTPQTSHERFSSAPNSNHQPRVDLLSVFKLALEEFDLLSGVRIYWDYTEKNIEQWAIKLKLKGEISISDPNYHKENPSLHVPYLRKSRSSRKPTRPSGLPSLFTPQEIKWNIGMNPDDLSVFGDVHINSYLSISGEYGDESIIGLYFRYAF